MSSKTWWVLAVVLALLLGSPFGAALLLTAVLSPAVAARPDTTCSTVRSAGAWRPPFVQAYTRTSPFGMRFHPIYHRWRLHSGTDLVSFPAPGPVVAAHDGTVTAAGPRPGTGNTVDIDHGGGTVTQYAHLARITPSLRAGTTVRAGQMIGVEGSTGTSTGNHLHFEIRLRGRPVDPVPFMAAHGAPLEGRAVPVSTPTAPSPSASAIPMSGLPPAGVPRRNSLATPPTPIPPRVKALYVAAATRYRLPWQLLAGIGMEESHHGATRATSPAGAQGLMQFMPGTFAVYGVDGDHDGRLTITSDADSIHSAANYLTKSGATTGPSGVRRALFAYNHADWYVNDVLHYAHAYAGNPTTSCP